MTTFYRCDFLTIRQAVDLYAKHGVTISRQAILKHVYFNETGAVKIGAVWYLPADTVLARIAARGVSTAQVAA